jgi:hypothetical protein
MSAVVDGLKPISQNWATLNVMTARRAERVLRKYRRLAARCSSESEIRLSAAKSLSWADAGGRSASLPVNHEGGQRMTASAAAKGEGLAAGSQRKGGWRRGSACGCRPEPLALGTDREALGVALGAEREQAGDVGFAEGEALGSGSFYEAGRHCSSDSGARSGR